MAEFDESKVINALHADRAEVGKRYWYSDSIVWLKKRVENNEPYSILKNFESPYFEVVKSESWSNKYFLLYPYEETPEKRMTNRQLAEWLAKGNGECTESKGKYYVHYILFRRKQRRTSKRRYNYSHLGFRRMGRTNSGYLRKRL